MTLVHPCIVESNVIRTGPVNPKNVNRGTLRYIEGLVLLIKSQFHALIHDRIQWKRCNPANLEILKTVKSAEFWMEPKILLSPYEVR
jgi:hypothetical protein